MRVNSVFDELELVTKMTISSKTDKEKNQTRTDNIEAGEVCQQIEEWTLQLRRTDITSNIENIIEDASELRFRWTRACDQDDHKLQNSQREEPNKNQ